jgi:outer membrane protein assembly factor BamB
MRKRYLVVCMVFLLVISSIGPLSFGSKLSENKIVIENYSTSNPLDGPMNSSWPMQCHDLHHTGRSPYSTVDNPGIEKWRFTCDGGVNGGPVIGDDGTIYFGDKSYPDYLYAVYPDGSLKWGFHADGWITSAPAIDEDGTVYAGSWDTNLYAINPNGSLKWFVGTGGSIACSPVIGEDGTIYIGNYGRKIVSVNPNGTIKWFYNTDDDITSDPAIGVDGTVYIGSLDNYLYALYSNGTLKWRFKTGDRIYGSPSIADDGTVYIGSSWDSYLYALYPNNGTMKWRYGGAGTPNNPSIGSDGTIYAGYLYDLLALYPNGTLKWDFYVGDDRYIGKSAPAISVDGTIYFGIDFVNNDGGEIIAVNPDGTERWCKQIADKWVDSSPCIADDGTVYIGSQCEGRGYLHAFGNIESNSPPEPPMISGETNGDAGKRYWYTFNSVDSDRNPVSFYIEWGDDTTTGWTMERGTGENCYFDHTWSETGTYTIRAKAKDVAGEESDWGVLEVTMPRTRTSYDFLFLRFLEQFPLLEKLLQIQPHNSF